MSEGNNFSIISIPAYFVLGFLPHAYAINVATGWKPAVWDNRNPRATELKSKLQSRLPQDVYAKYERCEAASSNCFEGMSLYIGAIIVGHLAKLDKELLNKFASRFLLVRAAYILAYMNIAKQSYTGLRTILWSWSIVMCFRIYLKAAKALAT